MFRSGLERKAVDNVLSKIDQFKVVSICRNLARISSYPGEEAEKAEYVAREMERLGLEVSEIVVESNRPNVIGFLEGDGTGKSLMLCAHLDTNWPLEGQEEIAHSAKIEDGKIYGIGTGDSMAPMAAFFGAIDAIKRARVHLKGDIKFITTVDELTYGLGGRALIENGIKADACIIGEPTDFNVGVVHSGRAEAEIRVKGTSLVELGAYAIKVGMPVVNAVRSMSKILSYLLRMEREDPYFHQKHPLLPGEGGAFYIGPIIGGATGYGSPTRKPGTERDGFGVAKPAPSWCNLRVGVRYWPNQTTEDFVRTLKTWINKAKQEDPLIEAEVNLYLDDPPAEISPKEDIVKVLMRSLAYVLGREPRIMGNVYWTEASLYQRAGIPTAWCGPPLHRDGTKDEHITIEELMNTAKIYTVAILNICGEEGYRL